MLSRLEPVVCSEGNVHWEQSLFFSGLDTVFTIKNLCFPRFPHGGQFVSTHCL